MARRRSEKLDITPSILLKAYACGIFPMAESADDPGLYWVEPERRGIFPLEGLLISKDSAASAVTLASHKHRHAKLLLQCPNRRHY